MQSMMLLGSWRQDTIADTSGVMQWRDTGSLGRTGREDEKITVDHSAAEQLECTELCLGMDDEPAGSLWVETKAWVTLPNQAEQVDKGFYRQLETALCLQALLLMGSFHHPGSCWVTNTAPCNQPRRLRESTEDNSPMKAAEETKKRGALLELNHNQGMTDWGWEGKRQPCPVRSESLNFSGKMEYILQKFQFQRGRRSKEHLILW